MRATTFALLTVAVLLATACGSSESTSGDTGTAASDGGRTITVELATQNDSGESGTATLTEQGSTTAVVLGLENLAAEVAQPAHIHKGTCAELDPAPTYPLTNVVDGASETTVDVPLEELEAGRFAINVHKSEAEADVYVACGDLGSAPAEDGGGDTGGGYGY
jgi:hypothetical protein